MGNLLACYDLAKSPPTHDIVPWLVRAEMIRKETGADGISVRIVPGQRLVSDRDKQTTPEYREWRIHNLLIPLARLLPSVTDVSIGGGEQTWGYSALGFVSEPIFKAPLFARQIVSKAIPAHAVTITLRNTDFEPARNSRQEEWEKVGDWLESKGYYPVFIPDQEADMRGKHVPTRFAEYVAASHNYALRVAAWERARLNLFTNGGNMVTALYSDAAALCFKIHIPEVFQCSDKDLYIKWGLSPEHDWSTPTHQKKFFWEDDTAKNIIPVLAEALKVGR